MWWLAHIGMLPAFLYVFSICIMYGLFIIYIMRNAILHPLSAQYKALAELDMFVRTSPTATDNYARLFDVLRRFRQK